MNWIALLAASVVGYIIPMIWYAPGVFGKTWMKLSGLKEMNPSAGIMIKEITDESKTPDHPPNSIKLRRT